MLKNAASLSSILFLVGSGSLVACSSAADEGVSRSTTSLSCADSPTSGASVVDDVTGLMVQGSFLERYNATGGLASVGRPITDVFDAVSSDGRVYQTQCFERRVFEYHPESADCRYRVLGRHLGRAELEARWGADPPRGSLAGDAESGQMDSATGMVIGARMLEHWMATGGLEENGHPITEEIEEYENGVRVRVQYFERAVFEYHPENGYPYDVLGRLLGNKEDACRARRDQLFGRQPPPLGPSRSWTGIDSDGCGHDGKPFEGCHAGAILEKIGEDLADGSLAAISCASCAQDLLSRGRAQRSVSGKLQPTMNVTWKDVKEGATCASCVKYLYDVGLFSSLACLADNALGDGCTYDPEGNQEICAFKCQRDFGQYGFVGSGSTNCVCTANHREKECRFACSRGTHMAEDRCTCVDD